MFHRAAVLTSLLLCASGALAGPPALSEEEEFFRLERASLEETLNIKTAVATRSALSLRETPGLVTVITRDEIQASGARDLLDVLRAVPEFEFGMDVQGNLGLGVRGNWANEGKVLLMWDGHTYNETLYSTLQFARFPVDQIEEIEIIRGPGSVIYGGFAELAVISIKTRRARDLGGSEAFAAYGQGSSARARTYAGYSYGRTFGGTALSAKAFWGEAQRSDRRYADFSGASYSMNRASEQRPRSLSLAAEGEDTAFSLILDDYALRDRDHFGSVLSTGSSKVTFPSVFASLAHKIYLPGLVRLEPRLSYARAMPWLEKDSYFTYDKRTQRLTANLTAFWRAAHGTELMAGGEYFHDGVQVDAITAAASKYASGTGEAQYDNYAFFGQAAFSGEPFNFTAGARFDKHSQYGASLVPRLAVTKLVDDLNFKVIYSQAFRAPAIENIRLNPGIDPERTTTTEFEAGYKASETLYVSASAFHTVIKDPIVFTVVNGAETYANYDRTGNSGFGLAGKYVAGGLRADLGYLYQQPNSNRVPIYAVPGHGSYLLAFPKHKLTLSASLPLAAGLTLNPGAVYTGRRYGYAADGALKAFGERVAADLNLRLRERPLKGLTLTLGVKDLFQSNYRYLQPYDGGHAPLPAASRELFLKAVYDF